MPRHSPFALRNLKSHEFESIKNHKTFVSRSKLTNDLTLFYKCFDLCNLTPKGSNLRCSRPLCSSQSTGGTPPSQRPNKFGTTADKKRSRGTVQPGQSPIVPVPQDPTACIYVSFTTQPFQRGTASGSRRTGFRNELSASMSMFHP
jgi:hypothetical protein